MAMDRVATYRQHIENMVPDGWKATTLGEISNVRRGASPRPIQDPKWFSDDGPGWVRIVDVTKSNRYLRNTEQKLSLLGVEKSVPVHPGDLIMSICATIGRPVIVDMEACIHDGFVLFDNLSSKVDTLFLLYFLSKESQKFESQGQPGTQKNLNTSIVKATPIALPPLPEQKKIAEILGSVDEAIASTQAVIDQTRKVKQGLLQQLLTKGIGHTKFKESAIGKIPEEWQIVTLEDVCEWIGVGIASAATHAYTKDGIPLIRNQNIKEGYIDTSELLYINTDFDLQNQTKRIKAGDVLTVRTGYPGLSAVVPPELNGCHCFTSLISRPQPDILDANFLCWWINSDYGKSFVLSGQAGGAQQNLNVGVLRKMLLPLPSIQEQAKISDMIFNVLYLLRIYEEEIEQHKLLKIALMQDLLTGRVRVKQTN